jgi:hypothetical protein
LVVLVIDQPYLLRADLIVDPELLKRDEPLPRLLSVSEATSCLHDGSQRRRIVPAERGPSNASRQDDSTLRRHVGGEPVGERFHPL